jgi:hypothetical protein
MDWQFVPKPAHANNGYEGRAGEMFQRGFDWPDDGGVQN